MAQFNLQFSLTDDVRRFRSIGITHRLPPGAELFKAGDTCAGFCYIHSGLIKLQKAQEDRDVIVDLRFPGQLIGLNSTVLVQPYSLTASVVNHSELTMIPRDKLQALLEADTSFALRLFRYQSAQSMNQLNRIAHIRTARAADELLELVSLFAAGGQVLAGGRVRSQIPLTQNEIADVLSVTPSYLSRLITNLEHAGVLSKTKGWLVFHKRQRPDESCTSTTSHLH